MPRRRFWSVFPASSREATDAIVANLLLHAFPARMRVTSLGWTPSLWLGTVSWVLFVSLLVTGLPLMVFYIPSTREAYQSIKDIEHVVSFGWWLRAAHRIAAHAMVIAVTLHLARVFLTGSYRNAAEREQHREWNWVIGVALLAATVLLSFTGYLLPWDQLAYWAVTTSMNIVASAPLRRPLPSLTPAWRGRGRAGSPDAFLRPPHRRPPDRRRRALRVPHVADSKGRRPGSPE